MPGVVDQDVDMTVPLQGHGDGGFDGAGVDEIQSQPGRGGETPDCLHYSIRGRDRASRGRQALRDRWSDAGRTVGDQKDVRRHRTFFSVVSAPSGEGAGCTIGTCPLLRPSR